MALNLYARKMAKEYAKKMRTNVCVSLACCIGKQEVNFYVTTDRGLQRDYGTLVLSPRKIIEELGLNKPIYKSMCKWGLFGEYQKDKAWEK